MARQDMHFCKTVMASIDDFRKEGFLCDMTLNVQGVLFNVHRNILAASSPYFKALFTSAMRENHEHIIKINDVNCHIMNDILTYLYCGTLDIKENKAIGLTVAADYMLLPKLKQMGIEFLCKNLTAANCLGGLAIAERYDFTNLKDDAQKYTLDNFAAVAQAEEFEKLSVEQLLAIVSCDDLVTKEQEVYEAIVRWTDFFIEDRRKHFDALFDKVRLVYLPRCYLVDVVKGEDLVNNSTACKSAVDRAQEYFTLSFEERKRKNLMPKPRTCQNGVLITGGWLQTNQITREARLFVPNLVECYELAPMIIPRKNHGATLHEGGVYVIGGASVEDTALNSVELYDPKANSWTSVMALHKEVAGVGVASLGSFIYAMGGHDSSGQPLNIVQRYDPKLNTWVFVAPMSESRTRLCVAATESKVYAFGGFSSADYLPLNTCESYEPETDAWCSISPMKSRRSGACSTYLNKNIYIIGGEDILDSPSVHDACEVYNTVVDSWSVIAPLCVPRSHAGIAAIKDKVYALCGVNKGRELHSIEYYDTVKCQWEVVSRLKVAIEGLACCVITVPGELLSSLM